MKHLALLLLLGCHRAPEPAAAPAPLRVQAGDLGIARLLAPSAARAAHAGAGPLAEISKGLLREGDRTGAFVEPSAACVLLFARGAASVSDVDLAAFSDDGEPLAIDEEPNATPSLVLCPPLPKRIYVSARAASGDGLVAIGGMPVPLAAAAAVRAAVSASASSGVPNRRVEQWPELERAARAALARLGPGAGELRRAGLAVDPTLTSTMSQEIPAGGCVALLLLADPPVAGLDVEVQDQAGALVLRTARPTDLVDNPLFSEAGQTLTVNVRPHVGRGLVGAIAYRIPSDPTLRVIPSRTSTHPPLPGKPAHRSVLPARPSALAHTEVKALEPDACYLWSAALDVPGARSSLVVFDAEYMQLARRDSGNRAAVITCGARDVRVAVGVREARGNATLTAHRMNVRIQGAAKAPQIASTIASVLLDLGAPLEQAKFSQSNTPVDLPSGQCAVIAGADLELVERGAPLLTRGALSNVRWLRLCADTQARHLELRASGLVGWAFTPTP